MENRRRQYSRRVIEEAFLMELKQKPLEKISVVDICRRADVNRSTFYSNYLDIYDLMDSVADSFFDELFHKCISELGAPNPAGSVDSRRLIEKALNATLEQRELCSLLMASRRAAFTKKLLDALLEWIARRYRVYSGRDDERFTLESTMMLGGALVLWQYWIEGGFREPPEQLAAAIEDFITENTRRIWGKGASV